MQDAPWIGRQTLVPTAALFIVLTAILVFIDVESVRFRQPIVRSFQLANVSSSSSEAPGTDPAPVGGPEPLRRWWEPPALEKWSTQSDFLRLCSELAHPIPADHSSNLAPLFAHPADQPIPTDVLFNEFEAAINGTEAIKSGAAPAMPMDCLRDPPHAPLPPVGSKPKIGIVVAYSPPKGKAETDSMYSRSLQDKQEYAARHGYELVVAGNLTMHPGRPQPGLYIKYFATLAHLRRFEWVWMVDLDTLIMNPKVPLEVFLDPRYDIIVAADCNGINTGSVFLRNSTWAFMYFAEIYAHNGDGLRNGPGLWPNWWDGFPENAVAWKLGENNQIRNHLKVPPQRLFNSYTAQDCAPEGTYKEGDFLVHFAGTGKPRFNQYWALRKKLLLNLTSAN